MTDRPALKPVILVVMGVSGSGKTTVATLLAERLHWPFEEGDALHPPANVAKMQGGVPLTDADREPWLRAIAAWIDERRAAGKPGVITCSALKREYRRIIIGDRPDVRLVYLESKRGLISRRLAARQGHFMPASLLDSQLAALEEPTPDEDPITVSIGPPPPEIVDRIVAQLSKLEAG